MGDQDRRVKRQLVRSRSNSLTRYAHALICGRVVIAFATVTQVVRPSIGTRCICSRTYEFRRTLVKWHITPSCPTTADLFAEGHAICVAVRITAASGFAALRQARRISVALGNATAAQTGTISGHAHTWFPESRVRESVGRDCQDGNHAKRDRQTSKAPATQRVNPYHGEALQYELCPTCVSQHGPTLSAERSCPSFRN